VCEDDVKLKHDRIKELMINIEAYHYELDLNKRGDGVRPVKLKEESVTLSSLNTEYGLWHIIYLRTNLIQTVDTWFNILLPSQVWSYYFWDIARM